MYDISELADKLAVNEETVRRWIRSGKLAAAEPQKRTGHGGGYIITEDALEAFLDEHPKYRRRTPDVIRIQTRNTVKALMEKRVCALEEFAKSLRQQQAVIEEEIANIRTLLNQEGLFL